MEFIGQIYVIYLCIRGATSKHNIHIQGYISIYIVGWLVRYVLEVRLSHGR